MTAKPSAFAPQVGAVLSAEARRVLPRLAARSVRRYVPLAALAPLTRAAYGALTGNERRAHLDRLALRLAAQHGAETASAMILELVAESVRAGAPDGPIEESVPARRDPARTHRSTQSAAAPVAASEPQLSGLYLPCAFGCGRERRTGSPRAQVWRCGNHRRLQHSRRRTEDEQ